ncbi:MAG: penicillin-binding protein [Ruminococcus sp.]|nr:penicillin-binding protein [Ruminococcus sp.]MBQ4239018.1 penicillin-binding protein [Ruminococcus sp.]
MKRIMTRSLVLWFVTFAFLGGIVYLGVMTVWHHNEWVQQPFNGHMASANGLGKAGKIDDRNDKTLAYSENNERYYSDDETTREALLHVIGDEALNISTGIQSRYRTGLSGYNFITGAGIPDSLRPNTDLKLTVDADSCRAAYAAMNGKKGACVVYNYKTGEVLCDVSAPSFDPADPPEITEENESEYDGVYLDNVVSSTFTPGSVFKIITAAAAIENIPDIDNQSFTCEGTLDVEGNPITCEYAHGTQSFKEAFANSCNCAFAQIATQVGDEKMKATAEKLGFNKDDFKMSEIPIATSHYDAMNAGDNALSWSGIGQYTDLANPMLMAMISGAVANGGTAAAPYIVEDDGNLINKLNIAVNKGGDVSMIAGETASRVKELMKGSAESYSWRGVSLSGLPFCAKTGTAEVGEDKEPTAWFVGFIDDDSHPYAFAATIVEGGYGITAATPVVEAAIGALVS